MGARPHVRVVKHGRGGRCGGTDDIGQANRLRDVLGRFHAIPEVWPVSRHSLPQLTSALLGTGDEQDPFDVAHRADRRGLGDTLGTRADHGQHRAVLPREQARGETGNGTRAQGGQVAAVHHRHRLPGFVVQQTNHRRDGGQSLRRVAIEHGHHLQAQSRRRGHIRRHEQRHPRTPLNLQRGTQRRSRLARRQVGEGERHEVNRFLHRHQPLHI